MEKLSLTSSVLTINRCSFITSCAGCRGDIERGVGGRSGADVAEAALPRDLLHGGHVPVAVHVAALLFA